MTDHNLHADATRRKSRDTFTITQFDWLRQVAADGGLSPSAARVAIALTKYFNRKQDGWAWMAQATLAHDLGMPVRTVGYILSGLIRRGHLVTKRRGKMETSLYHLALKNSECDRQPIATHDQQPIADHDRQPIATHSGVIGKTKQSDRQKPVKVIGNPLPRNPLNEPLEEHIESESDSLPGLDLDEEEGRLGQQKTAPDSTDADFEIFWTQYPRRDDKQDALKAYRGVLKQKMATPEQLLSGAMRYAAERSGQDSKYTKLAATWLRKGSWANEPAKPAGTKHETSGQGTGMQPAQRDATPAGSERLAPKVAAEPDAKHAAPAALSSEQHAKIWETLRGEKAARFTGEKFAMTVGEMVPQTVHLYVLPARVFEYAPQYRGYEYIQVGEEILIVDPSTHRIVAVVAA